MQGVSGVTSRPGFTACYPRKIGTGIPIRHRTPGSSSRVQGGQWSGVQLRVDSFGFFDHDFLPNRETRW